MSTRDIQFLAFLLHCSLELLGSGERIRWRYVWICKPVNEILNSSQEISHRLLYKRSSRQISTSFTRAMRTMPVRGTQRSFVASWLTSVLLDTKGWIVSIATAGAVFGCLACINLVQLWGRKYTMLVFTVIYIAGILGQTFSNGNLSALYATRFISGIGIGTTTVLPSIYLTEVSINF